MAIRVNTLTTAAEEEEKITRFDIHQMIQHAGLMVSFTLLVLTGFPLKFSEAAISQHWVGLLGGIEVTRSIHYFAAWVMVGVSLYHLGYLFHTIVILKRPFPIKMIPSLQDFTKFFQEIVYYLGIRKEMPKYDRFNWKEKFDYWAIFWGMPVMAGSGFILMFPVLATKFLPGWIVPAALVAHSDEALLALTWIAMVHIFFNHFSPSGFPFNSSMFIGKVPVERYRREHALEYERLMGAVEVVDENETDTQAGSDRTAGETGETNVDITAAVNMGADGDASEETVADVVRNENNEKQST